MIAIGKLRQRGFSLRRIRQINEYCQLALNRDRPLVTETFKTDGREVFVKAQGGFLLDVLPGRGTQAWDKVLDPFLETLDYEDELARRWWPRGQRGACGCRPRLRLRPAGGERGPVSARRSSRRGSGRETPKRR